MTNELVAAYLIGFFVCLGIYKIADSIKRLAISIESFYDNSKPYKSQLSSLVEAIERINKK